MSKVIPASYVQLRGTA